MKPFLLLAAGLVFVLGANALRSQTLWPGTTAGMTVPQVQAALPEAREPQTALELPAGRGTQLLELAETVVADRKFRVQFFFKPDRLVNVTLLDLAEVDQKEFETFLDLLRAKYCHEYSTTSGVSVVVRWNAVKTIVLLTWTPPGHDRGNGIMTISYEAPIPKDTDRL